MKKLILTGGILVLTAGLMFAQDAGNSTETGNPHWLHEDLNMELIADGGEHQGGGTETIIGYEGGGSGTEVVAYGTGSSAGNPYHGGGDDFPNTYEGGGSGTEVVAYGTGSSAGNPYRGGGSSTDIGNPYACGTGSSTGNAFAFGGTEVGNPYSDTDNIELLHETIA